MQVCNRARHHLLRNIYYYLWNHSFSMLLNVLQIFYPILIYQGIPRVTEWLRQFLLNPIKLWNPAKSCHYSSSLNGSTFRVPTKQERKQLTGVTLTNQLVRTRNCKRVSYRAPLLHRMSHFHPSQIRNTCVLNNSFNCRPTYILIFNLDAIQEIAI
jgi:hypothetical protein